MAQTEKSASAKSAEVKEMIRRSRHPAERPLTVISCILTLGVFAFLIWLVTSAIRKPADESAVISALSTFLALDKEMVADLLKMGAWAVLAIFIWLVAKYVIALLNERGRAENEDFTIDEVKSDLPERIARQYAEIVGLKETPELFFSERHKSVQLEDVKVYGEDFIVLSTYLLADAMSDERASALRFKLATKMASISLGYYGLMFQVMTVGGRLLPILRGLYIKTLVYSADRMAMEILKKDPEVKVTSEEVAAMMFESEYLVRTATGKLVNMDKVIEDRRKGFAAQGGLGQFFSRLLSEMPLLMDRVDALEHPEKLGRLI